MTLDADVMYYCDVCVLGSLPSPSRTRGPSAIPVTIATRKTATVLPTRPPLEGDGAAAAGESVTDATALADCSPDDVRPPVAPLVVRVVCDLCACDAELAPCSLDDRRGDAPGADGGGGGGGAGG